MIVDDKYAGVVEMLARSDDALATVAAERDKLRAVLEKIVRCDEEAIAELERMGICGPLYRWTLTEEARAALAEQKGGAA